MIYTHRPTVERLEAFCREHLGKRDDPVFHAYQAALVRFLLTKQEEQRLPHDNEEVFGMANAGQCLRNQAAKLAGIPEKEFSGAEQITFEAGHLMECEVLAILETDGWVLGGIQGKVRLPPTHCSYTDGLLTGGPVDLPYPVGLSLKIRGYKASSRTRNGWVRRGFPGLPLDGVHKAEPSWWVQAQLEMAGKNLKHELVIVLSRDIIMAYKSDDVMMGPEGNGSLSWYAELLERTNGDFVRRVQDMAEMAQNRDPEDVPPVVYRQSGFLALPAPGGLNSTQNKATTSDYDPCLYCNRSEWCQGVEMERALKASLKEGE